MHDQVLSWVSLFRSDEDLAVLDIGGRDLNGSPRSLFPNARPYHVLDLLPGPNVDIVADATDTEAVAAYISLGTYDLVICTEVFEHVKDWRGILGTAYDVLRPGGWIIFTCAGPGRPAHSGVSAKWDLDPGEHYGNVGAAQIREVLEAQGWTQIEVHQPGTDTQGKAVKPVERAPEVLLGAVLNRTV